jgi:hypothetical protein
MPNGTANTAAGVGEQGTVCLTKLRHVEERLEMACEQIGGERFAVGVVLFFGKYGHGLCSFVGFVHIKVFARSSQPQVALLCTIAPLNMALVFAA